MATSPFLCAQFGAEFRQNLRKFRIVSGLVLAAATGVARTPPERCPALAAPVVKNSSASYSSRRKQSRSVEHREFLPFPTDGIGPSISTQMQNEAYTTALKSGVLRHVMPGGGSAKTTQLHRSQHSPSPAACETDARRTRGTCRCRSALAAADRSRFLEHDRRLPRALPNRASLQVAGFGQGLGLKSHWSDGGRLLFRNGSHGAWMSAEIRDFDLDVATPPRPRTEWFA